MTDRECVEFLQWALPKMRMRWQGFRRVRRQVCKRISQRISALDLAGIADYRAYLEAHTSEWTTLASLCRVTISRFYRDRSVFDHLGNVVLPRLAAQSSADVRCWSVGCASGEEAYTMQILWTLRANAAPREKTLHILGTDSDPHMLERARNAEYPSSVLRELPHHLTAEAFDQTGDSFVLKASFKENVVFEERDILQSMPSGPFDVILCRNLVFTYFEESLQREILGKMLGHLRRHGVLVTALHESLPEGNFGLAKRARAVYEQVRA